MSKRVGSEIGPFVGQVVYPIGHPQRAGMIVQLGMKTRYSQMVAISWDDGSTSSVEAFSLNDFDSLIGETARKLHTHRTRRDKLASVVGIGNLPPAH